MFICSLDVIMFLRILNKVKSWLKVHYADASYDMLLMFVGSSRRNQFRKRVGAAVLNGLIYFVWWGRNEAVWNYVGWHPDMIFNKIKCMVLDIIQYVLPKDLCKE